MADRVSVMLLGVLLLVTSTVAMFSHFTPSQLIKEYMRQTANAASLARSFYEASEGVTDTTQSCPPYLDAKACERRAKVLSAAHLRKHNRDALHNKARAILAINENRDDRMNGTLDLVSLLRTSQQNMDETPLSKNGYELKMKDIASTLKVKNKDAIAAMQSWFCTTTLFC